MTSPRENLLETLSNVAPPLHAQLREIDGEIEKVQATLVELRETKTELIRVLKVIDPTNVPTAERSAPKKKRATNGYVSEEKVVEIEQYLREKYADEDDGFYASAVLNNGYTLTSPPTLRAAIEKLHERGTLRLDRTEKGGKRWYVFT